MDQIHDDINQLLASQPKEYLIELQETFNAQAKAFKKEPDKLDAVFDIHEKIDKTNAEYFKGKAAVSCKKGCAHCCHIQVKVFEPEADLILEYCQDNDITIDMDRLEKQLGYDEFTYMLNPHRRCVFLADDNTCKVYDVRPGSCRNYFVTSPPDDCNTYTNSRGKVLSVMNLKAYALVMSMAESCKMDHLQQFLLNRLKQKNGKYTVKTIQQVSTESKNGAG